MFVTGITERIDLGGGDWAEIRKLSGRQLEKARRTREREAAENARAFGGDVLAALRQIRQSGELETALAADVDPLDQYDRWDVLAGGIVAWSADRKVTREAIDELDDDAATAIARAILALSLPARDPADAEAARKNA